MNRLPRGSESHDIIRDPGELIASRLRFFFGAITCCIIPTLAATFVMLVYSLALMANQDPEEGE